LYVVPARPWREREHRQLTGTMIKDEIGDPEKLFYRSIGGAIRVATGGSGYKRPSMHHNVVPADAMP